MVNYQHMYSNEYVKTPITFFNKELTLKIWINQFLFVSLHHQIKSYNNMTLFVSVRPKSVKVSYNSYFDNNGTHYSQMVSVVLTDEQLEVFNNMVNDTQLSKGVSEYTKMHLRSVKFGDNYTNLTTFDYFRRFFEPLKSNSRIKADRNTLLRIKKG